MPIRGTTGVFNSGRDLTVILQGDFGQVQINNITGFEARQVTKNIDVDCLNGVQLTAELPQRWDGTIDFERGDAIVDLFFAQREANWYSNGTYFAATIYATIIETNSVTNLAYDNVALKYDAGRWQGDAAIKSKIEFRANRRRML